MGGREGGRKEGRKEGREGRRVLDTRALHNAQVQAWLCTYACQWFLAFILQ